MASDPGLFEIMYSCRAMRRLSGAPVPEADLLKLVEAAGQAASGSNRQRARWLIVRDPEQKRRLADINRRLSERFVQERIDGGEALPHHRVEKRRRMLEAVLWLAQNMHAIHALFVACLEFDEPPTPAAVAAAQSSVWPGVQNLLLAARGLELGAVLTTYALNEYEAFAEVLDLPAHVRAYGLIPVGYPLGKFGPVTRLPVAEVTHFDRW